LSAKTEGGPRMTAKQNTTTDAARRLVSVPVGEAPVVLPDGLAAELDELTARFAEHMGKGLRAASVAIGLRGA